MFRIIYAVERECMPEGFEDTVYPVYMYKIGRAQRLNSSHRT